MLINTHAKFGGLFKMEVRKKQTNKLVTQTDWMKNIVLNQGLDFMATEHWVRSCAVGTDGSKPVETQTGLIKEFATTGDQQETQSGCFNENGIIYYWYRIRFRFPAGTFDNTTLAEVAVINNNKKCWNRALITDSDGKPTTLTVLNDEYLDVTCEIRSYYITEDQHGTIDIVDKNNNLIKTINTITRPSSLKYADSISLRMLYPLRSWLLYNRASLGKSKIGDVNSLVSDAFYTDSIADTYITGSYKLSGVIRFGLDVANNTDYLVFSTGFNDYPAWQVGFSEPIRKTNTQIFNFHVSMTWGRL